MELIRCFRALDIPKFYSVTGIKPPMHIEIGEPESPSKESWIKLEALENCDGIIRMTSRRKFLDKPEDRVVRSVIFNPDDTMEVIYGDGKSVMIHLNGFTRMCWSQSTRHFQGYFSTAGVSQGEIKVFLPEL